MLTMYSVIMSIPGIKLLNGAMILVKIVNISRFSNPSKLLAFAGLNPIARESSKSKSKEIRMSKKDPNCSAIPYKCYLDCFTQQ